MVTGTQTEGTERMLFTRVYVMGSSGGQSLASMQFRNPHFRGRLMAYWCETILRGRWVSVNLR
jgi:hypothetical protein